MHEDDEEPMVGLLLRSMYGTQDAARIFQEDYQGWMPQKGAKFCKLCPSLFRVEERQLLGLVHGDDFLAVGPAESLKWLGQVLSERYTARWEATLGGDGT